MKGEVDVIRGCLGCGRNFSYGSKRQLYCSDDCRRKSYSKQNSRAKRLPKYIVTALKQMFLNQDEAEEKSLLVREYLKKKKINLNEEEIQYSSRLVDIKILKKMMSDLQNNYSEEEFNKLVRFINDRINEYYYALH